MTLAVTPGSGQTIKVLDDIVGTAGTPNGNVLSVQGVSGGTALPVSAAALPLPTGAATEASLASVKTAAETVAGAVSSSKMASKTADGDDAALGAMADAAATTDAGTFSLIALVKRMLGYVAACLAGTSSLAVKTNQRVVSIEVTRPANTDNYAAKDVWGDGTVITLADLFSGNGGSGYISKVVLEGNQAADVLQYRIYFFNVAPTAIADGSPFTLLYADVAKRIGYVDINNMSAEGSGGDAAMGFWTGQLAAKAASDSDNGYAVIVINNAQTTPPSGKKMTLTVTLDSNG
jgi:hypothetical protein